MNNHLNKSETPQQKHLKKLYSQGWIRKGYVIPGEVAEALTTFKNTLVEQWRKDHANQDKH